MLCHNTMSHITWWEHKKDKQVPVGGTGPRGGLALFHLLPRLLIQPLEILPAVRGALLLSEVGAPPDLIICH
jgi:hypothetical protein